MATRQRSGAGPDRTSRLLLEIRGTRRQVEAEELSGLTQARISRAERARVTLSPAEADRYARALGATAAQRRELVALCEAAQANALQGQARLVRRGPEIQRRIRELEQQASLLRSWQPTMVPGLFQTWDYTLALIEREPPAAWTSERRGRLALLDDETKRFQVLLSEAALRWTVGSRAVMAGQLAHLEELSQRPNIAIGVVPFGQSLVPPPEAAFHLYGERTAVVATDAGTTFLNDRQDLDGFAGLFDRLHGVAVFGDAAAPLFRQAAQ